MSNLLRDVLALAIGSVLFAASNASAGTLAWDGELLLIFNDSGTGAYTGGTPGVSMFSGELASPDVCGATCLIEPFGPNATNYVFSNGAGTIEGLGTNSVGIESSIEVINDEVITQDIADLATLYGVTLTVGQTLDTWAFGSENDAEFTSDFVTWGVSFVYTNNPFSDTSFVATPPPNPAFILWEIDEDDEDAYAAIGIATVPEPATTFQLAAGIFTIAGLIRRRQIAVKSP